MSHKEGRNAGQCTQKPAKPWKQEVFIAAYALPTSSNMIPILDIGNFSSIVLSIFLELRYRQKYRSNKTYFSCLDRKKCMPVSVGHALAPGTKSSICVTLLGHACFKAPIYVTYVC